jgi:hypothetical protein
MPIAFKSDRKITDRSFYGRTEAYEYAMEMTEKETM